MSKISTQSLMMTMVKVVNLSDVLECIGHPDLPLDKAWLGESAYTLFPAERVGTMVDILLGWRINTNDDILAFFHELHDANVYINMKV